MIVCLYTIYEWKWGYIQSVVNICIDIIGNSDMPEFHDVIPKSPLFTLQNCITFSLHTTYISISLKPFIYAITLYGDDVTYILLYGDFLRLLAPKRVRWGYFFSLIRIRITDFKIPTKVQADIMIFVEVSVWPTNRMTQTVS